MGRGPQSFRIFRAVRRKEERGDEKQLHVEEERSPVEQKAPGSQQAPSPSHPSTVEHDVDQAQREEVFAKLDSGAAAHLGQADPLSLLSSESDPPTVARRTLEPETFDQGEPAAAQPGDPAATAGQSRDAFIARFGKEPSGQPPASATTADLASGDAQMAATEQNQETKELVAEEVQESDAAGQSLDVYAMDDDELAGAVDAEAENELLGGATEEEVQQMDTEINQETREDAADAVKESDAREQSLDVFNMTDEELHEAVKDEAEYQSQEQEKEDNEGQSKEPEPPPPPPPPPPSPQPSGNETGVSSPDPDAMPLTAHARSQLEDLVASVGATRSNPKDGGATDPAEGSATTIEFGDPVRVPTTDDLAQPVPGETPGAAGGEPPDTSTGSSGWGTGAIDYGPDHVEIRTDGPWLEPDVPDLDATRDQEDDDSGG